VSTITINLISWLCAPNAPPTMKPSSAKKTLTSAYAQGTAFGDLIETFEDVTLAPNAVIRTSWLAALIKRINTQPSLYLKAGAIHGRVLSHRDKPLLYLEGVGRYNAVDKTWGYMFLNNVTPEDKIFYATGRLTSEMVIKCVNMRILSLVSGSGFTAWRLDLAGQGNLTLIGRARGRRFFALSGHDHIICDPVATARDESSACKGTQ
jgi:FdhD protein